MDRGEALRVEKFDSLVVESEVPLKDKIVKRYVVNWADNLKMTEDDIYKSFAKFNKRKNEDEKQKEDIETKIANTICVWS